VKELPAGPALLSAGSQRRPDASAPLPAHQGSTALGNSPINNSLTKSLLSSIVGRWNSRVKQKPEHSVTMLAETLSECSRLGWQILLPGQGQYSALDFEHNPVESVLWDFVSKMPDMKEPLELNEQAISKAFVGLIGQSRKKFDVPNQVGQAELLNLRLFDWLTTAYIAAVATISVKRDRLVNLILPEWLSIAAFMTRLTPLLTGTAGLFGFGRLDNIRGWRLGRIGGILGKFGDLFGKLSYPLSKCSVFLDKLFVGFEEFGNLLFKFCNTSFIELFSFRCQFLPSNYSIWLLSGKRGPPLEKGRFFTWITS